MVRNGSCVWEGITENRVERTVGREPDVVNQEGVVNQVGVVNRVASSLAHIT